jgi:hypothetical protein
MSNIIVPRPDKLIVEEDIYEKEKPAPPTPMHARKSMEIYPRKDNIYKTKSSFNFDMMRTKIFEVRRGAKEEIWLWVAHGLTGCAVGIVAFLMALAEDHLTRFKADKV